MLLLLVLLLIFSYNLNNNLIRVTKIELLLYFIIDCSAQSEQLDLKYKNLHSWAITLKCSYLFAILHAHDPI
ncbi:hypothetical protein CW311_20445 [Acinetobacter proteolyticus]|uniref:Uncharacterized protein n=1 Tax=Acinetobacter proteolyticus TaxID=1776741 RepID=A0A2N0W9F5_9GAMM|nr:hypothetical protein CW311_20445 [Acinetobacter proteolyticus]